MNRKTLTALGVFFVLGAIAIFAIQQPEKGERTADRARPVAKLDPGGGRDPGGHQGRATTVLKSEAGNVQGDQRRSPTPPTRRRRKRPSRCSARWTSAISSPIRRPSRPSSRSTTRAVSAWSPRRPVARCWPTSIIGKSSGGGDHGPPPGEGRGLAGRGASRSSSSTRPRPTGATRASPPSTSGDAERSRWRARTTARSCSRRPAPRRGPRTSGSCRVDLAPARRRSELDNSGPERDRRRCPAWKANDFADGVKPADTGLEAPALTVTVGPQGGQEVTRPRAASEEGWRKRPTSRSADAPADLPVKKFNLERVNKRPVEFRDKTLCDLRGRDLTEISVDGRRQLVHRGQDRQRLEGDQAGQAGARPGQSDANRGRLQGLEGERDRRGSRRRATASASRRRPSAPRPRDERRPACSSVGDESEDKVSYHRRQRDQGLRRLPARRSGASTASWSRRTISRR